MNYPPQMRNFRLRGNSTRYNNFNSFINNNNLIDLGSIGNPFTWHKREKHADIFSRLDRALANYLWIKLYQASCVEHLLILGSDHAPILIDAHTRHHNSNRASFKFETKWLLDEDYLGLVSSICPTYIRGSNAYQLTRKLIFLNKKSKKGELTKKRPITLLLGK